MYDGHQRLSVLKAARGPSYEVDVRRSSRPLTEKEREELVIAAHTGTVGAYDWDALAGWDFDDLGAWGFDADTLAQWNDDAANLALMLEAEEEEPPEDPGPQIDKAEELREKWGVETGQLWQLGEHRLICGDCTDAAVVERVMGGERADCAFTDPPFAIYGSSTGVSQSVADTGMVRPFFRDIGLRLAESLRFFAHVYICCDWRSFCVLTSEVGRRLVLKNMIVWTKPGGNVSGTFYTNVHELLALLVYEPPQESIFKKKTGHRPVYDQNVWEQSVVPVDRREHFAEKPIENVERAVGNSTEDGESVIDLFLGSGTTLIACERLGRRCRAVEISPAYVAVTLERWSVMTGREPVLVES